MKKEPWTSCKWTTHIDNNVDPENPEISPMIVVEYVERGTQPLVGSPARAEIATRGRRWVGEIATNIGYMLRHK